MAPTRYSLRTAAAVASVALVVFATAAAAHDTWLLPRSMHLAVGQPVTLSLTSGMAFPADDFAINASRVVRATVRLAGVTAPLARPAKAALSLDYRFTPQSGGIAAFAVELAPKVLALGPDKIEEYFADINASKALRAQWDSVPSPKQWRERYTKHAASYVSVGSPAADSSWRQPLGMAFEIVPEMNPLELRAGQLFRVRVTRAAQPAANVEVGLQHAGDTHVSFTRTGADGRAQMMVPRSGRWLVNVTDLRRSTSPGLEWESDFATLTLSVARR